MSLRSDHAAYVVVGGGAIGLTIASHLVAAGRPVTIVDTDHDHVAHLSAHGAAIKTGDQWHGFDVDAVLPEEATETEFDRVYLAVKSQHVEAAASWLAPRMTDTGVVTLCQNGDTWAAATSALDHRLVVSAFVNFAADKIAPGRVVCGGHGDMAIGEYPCGASERSRKLTRDLASLARDTENVRGLLWSKRGFAAILAATSVIDDDIAATVDNHRAVLAETASEVYAIATACGVELEAFDAVDPEALTSTSDIERTRAFDALVRWLRSMPKTRSGVFRDIARRRKSEASYDLEELLVLSESYGLRCPRLGRLADLLAEITDGHREFSATNLVELSS